MSKEDLNVEVYIHGCITDYGFEYLVRDTLNKLTIIWKIPENIGNGIEIKRNTANTLNIRLLRDNIKLIKLCNSRIQFSTSAAEEAEIEDTKTMLKQQCFNILNSMNRGIKPYHCEIPDILEDVQSKHTKESLYCVIIIDGEDELSKAIEKL